MYKKAILGSFVILMLSWQAKAGNIAITGPFSGLNNTDGSITLTNGESPDTLNVEVSKDQQALKKRAGYVKTHNLTISTSPVKGSAHFTTSSGHDIKIMAHDHFVSASTDDGEYADIVTTATNGAEWKFCVASGKAYGFNSEHDEIFSYDGTTVLYYPAMPKGSVCAMTPTKMLIAGTTDYPNRLYFSKTGDITNFTVGIEPEDASFDDIGLSGEAISTLFASESEWLIFKSNSITSYQGTNQFDLVAYVVSDRVGVSDPNAIVAHEGIVYLKSSEGKIYAYAGGTLTELSGKIANFISGIVTNGTTYKYLNDESSWDDYGVANSWIDGAVQPTVYSSADDSASDFAAGTPTTPVSTGTYVELKSKIRFGYMSFETNDTSTIDWNCTKTTGFSGGCIGLWFPRDYVDSPPSAEYGARYQEAYSDAGSSCWVWVSPSAYDYSSNNAIFIKNISALDTTQYFQIDISTQPQTTFYVHIAHKPNPHDMVIYTPYYAHFSKNNGILNMSMSRKHRSSDYACMFDFQNPSVGTASSGTFISQIHTITAPEPHYGYLTWSANPAVTMSVRNSSSATGQFDDWKAVTDGSLLVSTGMAYQYKAVLTNSNDGDTAYLYSGSFIFKSTSIVESPEIYLGGFNTWGKFIADETTNSGGPSHWTYQMKTSTYVGGTDDATYAAVTSGSAITISTGAYAKVKAQSSFVAGTETVKLNGASFSCSRSAPSIAMGIEYLGDIYFTVPYDNATTNNRTMKLDIDSGGWQIFDIPMNVPFVSNDIVYFGGTTGGYVYKYPYGNSDNGAAINSYWKTKDFLGDNPYVEKDFQKISSIFKSDSGTDVDLTYTINTSTYITYTVGLSSSTQGYIPYNRQFPIGSTGHMFNLQVGNNAANQPWTFYGTSVDYLDRGWRVFP